MKILHLLAQRGMTTSELVDEVAAGHDRKSVTQRQIQRDIKVLEESGIPIATDVVGRQTLYSIPSHVRSLMPITITNNELLSVYVLKSTLQAFRNSRVERDVDALLKKLERVAPGKVFMSTEIVADVSPGRFTNTVSDDVFRTIIDAIVDPHWDRVTYRSINAGTSKTFIVSFCRLINHAGRLYVAAWHPKYKHYITLAVDAIEHVERASDITDTLHVFNEGAFRKDRFGVYDGKQHAILLHINASAAPFFTKRDWHTTQQFRELRNGNVELKMHAALSPELVSWVMSWAHEVKVVKPKALVDVCKERAKSVLEW